VRWIERVEKLDTYKVRIVCGQPFPAAIAYLAFCDGHASSCLLRARRAARDEREPVGTGPYRVVAPHSANHSIGTLPSYWKGSPKAASENRQDRYPYIPDAQTRVPRW